MARIKRPNQIRKVIAQANSTDIGEKYSSFTSITQGDRVNASVRTRTGFTDTLTPVTSETTASSEESAT